MYFLMDVQIHISKNYLKKVEYKLGDKFGYNRGYASKLKSETVFRSGIFAEVDCSSVFF